MAVSGNLAMIESEHLPENRNDFLKEMKRKPFEMAYGKCIDEMSFGTKIRWGMRRLLGNKQYDALKALGKRK